MRRLYCNNPVESLKRGGTLNNADIKKRAVEIVKLWNTVPKETQDFLKDTKGLSVHKTLATIFQKVDSLAKGIRRGQK